MTSQYWVCITCGSLTPTKTGLCNYCSTPLPNFLHSPNPTQMSSGVHLGCLTEGYDFRIPLTEFGFHFAFLGATGGGKTRAAMKLAIEAEHAGLKLLILDVEGEWKNIIPQLKGETAYYSTDNNLRINPYDLNDFGLVSTLLKETTFKGIEAEYLDLSPQMNFVLDRCIRSSTSIPTLIDNVITYEESDIPFKLANLDKTKAALLVRLEPYKANPALNETFYVETSSIDLEKLDHINTVIDLHSLEAQIAYKTELRLIYNAIAIAYLKLALHREITDAIRNLFLADEAQLLVPKILRKVVVTDTHMSTEFSSRLRKRGQSIAIITQSPSNIEDDLRRNCQNVFVFRLQDAKDIELIARSFGYNDYKALGHFSQELTNLLRRQALVKTPLINEPFRITTSDLNLPPISEDVLHKFVPRHEATMTEQENEFLLSLERHPFLSMVERRSYLSWDDRKYNLIVGRLVGKGIIEKARVRIGKGGSRVLYQAKDSIPSIKHEFYVHWIAEQLKRQGFVCALNRVGADIVVSSPDVSIEVELGKSDIFGNIRKDLEEHSRVIVCSDSKKVFERVLREVKDSRIQSALIEHVPALLVRMRSDAQDSLV